MTTPPAEPAVDARQPLAASVVCPGCGYGALRPFYVVRGVPANPELLAPTRLEALDPPSGDIHLAFCPNCGLISNILFDPQRAETSTNPQESPGHQRPLTPSQRALARRWVERYDLKRKQLVEVGSGRGDFLLLLCELGKNYGVGVDPAYVPHRITSESASRVQFIQDFYSEKYDDLIADFLCCRVLHRVAEPGQFLKMIRRAIGKQEITLALEVPDVTPILQQGAFWQISYPHCSYFTPGSLARLVRSAGFELLSLDRIHGAYGGRSIILEAKPVTNPAQPHLPLEEDLDQTATAIAPFAALCRQQIQRWEQRVRDAVAAGQRLVFWGAGAAAAAFLSAVHFLPAEIACIVDPHPHRPGKFLPGAGLPVVSPDALRHPQTTAIILLDPSRAAEIQMELERRSLTAAILTPTP